MLNKRKLFLSTIFLVLFSLPVHSEEGEIKTERKLVFNAAGNFGYTFSSADGLALGVNGGITYFLFPAWGLGFQPELNTLGSLILPLTLTYRTEPGWLGFSTYNTFGVGLALGNYSGLSYFYEGSLNFDASPNIEFYIGPRFLVTGNEQTKKNSFMLGLQTGFRF